MGTSEHVAYRRPAVRWIGRSAIVIVIVAGLLAGVYGWLHAVPTPPDVDLADASPLLAQAIGDARAAVLREPGRADLWGQFGMILYQHRFVAEARTCFIQAERLDAHEPRWPYLCAQIDRVDDAPGAIAALERALAADADNTTVRLQLAELLLEQGRLDDAERHLREVMDSPHRRPLFDDARAALGLARTALQRDQLDRALELAQRSERALPSMKAPHVVLAEIHLRRGDQAAAQREQRRLAALTDSKWPDPYLEEAERLSVEVHTRIDLARRFLAQGRSAEGLALLEETVQANPKSTPAWISLGQAHLRRGEWRLAQEALERALALHPGEAIALADLGFALSRQDQLDRAVDCYQQAIARNPQNPENYYHLSYCELRRGKSAEAIAALRTAVRVRPQFALAWRELGQILAGRGERAEARACLERAVDLAPDDEAARKLLGELR